MQISPRELPHDPTARSAHGDAAVIGASQSLAWFHPADADALLLAFADQVRALRVVWEAHERGVITLPADVAARVREAQRGVPGFLR